jgi:hypothetical protein
MEIVGDRNRYLGLDLVWTGCMLAMELANDRPTPNA